MKNLRKILPYVVLIVITVVSTKILDHLTSTDMGDIEKDKKELLKNVEGWKNKFAEAEKERLEIQKKYEVLNQEINNYEIENDTIITDIRVANDNRDFAKLDSIGGNLLGRLRKRRQP